MGKIIDFANHKKNDAEQELIEPVLTPSEKQDLEEFLDDFTRYPSMQYCYGHKSPVHTLCFSDNGSTLISASDEAALVMHANGKKSVELTGHRGDICCACLSRDGKSAYTAGREGIIRRFDAKNGMLRIAKEPIINSKTEVPSFINRLRCTPDQRFIAAVSSDGTAGLFDAQTLESVYVKAMHSGIAQDIDVSPDGKYLASCATDGKVRLFETQTGDTVRTVQFHRRTDYCVTVGQRRTGFCKFEGCIRFVRFVSSSLLFVSFDLFSNGFSPDSYGVVFSVPGMKAVYAAELPVSLTDAACCAQKLLLCSEMDGYYLIDGASGSQGIPEYYEEVYGFPMAAGICRDSIAVMEHYTVAVGPSGLLHREDGLFWGEAGSQELLSTLSFIPAVPACTDPVVLDMFTVY